MYRPTSLPRGDASADLIPKTIFENGVGLPGNVITHETFEVNWLRALSFTVCRSYPIQHQTTSCHQHCAKALTRWHVISVE